VAIGPAAIARLVGDDGEQPGPEGRVRPKASKVVVRLDERLLGRVFRFRRVAADQIGGAKGQILVLFHQQGVGVGVAPLRPDDQVAALQ
jgi:hypothetical protein